MTDLSLEEAAKYIGMPQGVLHAWTWAKAGPKQSNQSYWHPRYTTESLNAWLAAQGIHVRSNG